MRNGLKDLSTIELMTLLSEEVEELVVRQEAFNNAREALDSSGQRFARIKQEIQKRLEGGEE